jgi:hypothetical protein
MTIHAPVKIIVGELRIIGELSVRFSAGKPPLGNNRYRSKLWGDELLLEMTIRALAKNYR